MKTNNTTKILIEAKQWLNENYPNAPKKTLKNIINNYINSSPLGKKITRKFLNRLPNLLIGFAKKEYTQYESFNSGITPESLLIKWHNQEAQKIIKKWKKK